jgi:hypothetical protein
MFEQPMSEDDHSDLHLSLAERRTRRFGIKMPLRFRDVVPQSLPILYNILY